MSERVDMPAADKRLQKDFPEIAEHYDYLGSACHEQGPLDEKTRLLVKLSVSIGAQMEEPVKAYSHRLKLAGASIEEVRHAILLTLTTLGFPATARGLAWAEEGHGVEA